MDMVLRFIKDPLSNRTERYRDAGLSPEFLAERG
jgi:hypothetical protein